jgi:hypothetical protein
LENNLGIRTAKVNIGAGGRINTRF